MANITVTAVVLSPKATLENYSQIKFKRSTLSRNGPWQEITTPTTRPSIALDKLVYTFQDTSGSANYWYCNSYYDPISQLEGSLSDPQKGQGDPALNIVSVASLKGNYLFGLDLSDPDGVEMPDSFFEFYIRSAVSWMETNLGLPLRPTVIEDERHPFYAHLGRRFLMTKLNKMPVQSIQQVKLVWPGQYAEQVQPLPADWVRLDQNDGSFVVVPAGGITSNFPVTGFADSAWAGLTGGGVYSYMNSDFLPEVIRVDYLSGFPNGQVPQEIVEVISKIASYGPLNAAGDLIGGAGIASQSSSIDGLSESINTTSSPMFSGYGARLNIYQNEVKEQIPTIRGNYRGIGFRVM